MAKFEVRGFALGVIDVWYDIEASTRIEAKKKAAELFKSGNHGLMTYSDDDAAAIEFSPLSADIKE